jgi:hypothetical protein
MKRVAAIIFGLASCLPIYALPLANPAEPILFPRCNCADSCRDAGCSAFSLFNLSNYGFGIGYYGDFVYDRRMGNGLPSTFSKTKIATNAASVVLNLYGFADIFSTLGVSKITQSGYGNAFGGTSVQLGFPPPRPVTLESQSSFSWSVGGRAAIIEWCHFGLGLEGQYFKTSSEVNYIADNLFSLSYPSGVPMRYSEWQVGCGLYYKIESPDYCPCFAAVPYIGVKGGRARMDFNNAVILIPDSVTIDAFHLVDQESTKRVGFAVGATLSFYNRVGLTLEGRFRDETAFFVNAEVRF